MVKIGDLHICAYRWQWRECEECGAAAVYESTFLLPNCRTNPASSAYGLNDCSYCSDEGLFVCEEHKYVGMAGFERCSLFPLSRFPHKGWYKVEDKKTAAILQELWDAAGNE